MMQCLEDHAKEEFVAPVFRRLTDKDCMHAWEIWYFSELWHPWGSKNNWRCFLSFNCAIPTDFRTIERGKFGVPGGNFHQLNSIQNVNGSEGNLLVQLLIQPRNQLTLVRILCIVRRNYCVHENSRWPRFNQFVSNRTDSDQPSSSIRLSILKRQSHYYFSSSYGDDDPHGPTWNRTQKKLDEWKTMPLICWFVDSHAVSFTSVPFADSPIRRFRKAFLRGYRSNTKDLLSVQV